MFNRSAPIIVPYTAVTYVATGPPPAISAESTAMRGGANAGVTTPTPLTTLLTALTKREATAIDARRAALGALAKRYVATASGMTAPPTFTATYDFSS